MHKALRSMRPWALSASIVAFTSLSACNGHEQWRLVDMDGRLPSLALDMTSVNEGKPVTGLDFRGKIVVLEFGYTSCPDVCPTTLANLSRVLRDLGSKAQDVRVLFVTVDPDRDTPQELKRYVGNFAPQVIGLRGTANQLATLARRYRVAYSVTPAPIPSEIKVMHTPTLYIFDRDGRARLLSPRIDDNSGVEHDLRQLVDERHVVEHG